MKIQLALTKGPPLEISYPKGFNDKSIKMAKEIHIGMQQKIFTLGEYFFLKEELKKRNREKHLQVGTVFLDEGDPLLKRGHEELDTLEEKFNFRNTKKNPKGGNNSITQRVVSIRENGYFGNGYKALIGK